MRRATFLLAGCLVLLNVFGTPVAFAQPEDVDTIYLQQLYKGYLRDEKNVVYYDQKIAEERNRIRGLLQKEIEDIVSPAPETGETSDVSATSDIIDRQRNIVADLTGRLNESTVDLNLLSEEERLYENGAEPPDGALTASLPELLAKKAVLEEDINLVSTALNTQEKRLERLLSEQRMESIGILLTVLWYFLLVFVGLWAEHFLRTKLILRIPHRKLRYALAKAFTLVVYLSLFVWIIQRVLVEHPGLLTILAVIGAALVFMLQDIIKSFIGWFTYKDAFALGQRMNVGDYTGDVLDISMLFTTMLVSRSSTLDDATKAGKVVRIPNSALLTGPLINYHSTSDYENVEIPIRLAHTEDWEKAKPILEEIVSNEAKGYTEQAMLQMDKRMRGFYFSQVSPSYRVYMDWSPKGRLVCLCCFPAPIGQRRLIVTQVLEKIFSRFKEENIEIGEGE